MPDEQTPKSGEEYIVIRNKNGEEQVFRKVGNADATIRETMASLPEQQQKEIEELMNQGVSTAYPPELEEMMSQGASAAIPPEYNQTVQDQIAHDLLKPQPDHLAEVLERVEALERRFEELEGRVAHLENTKPRQ